MLSKFSVKRPVTVVMVTLIFMIFGAVSFTNLSTDLFPSLDLPYGAVSITYVGASPEEVESIVSAPVEATLQTVENIKSVQSISSEFHALLILEFNDGTDIDMAMLEVREKLDQIQGSLPEEVSDPMVIKFNPNMMPIMSFSLTQDGKDMVDVTRFVNQTVKQRIEKLEGVASLSVSGGSSRQIEVILDKEKLDALGLDATMISNLLMAQNFNFPIGNIEEADKNYTLRASSEFSSIEDIQEFIIAKVPEVKTKDNHVIDPFTTLQLQKSIAQQIADNTLDYTKLSEEEAAVLAVLSNPDQVNENRITLKDLGSISYVEKNSNTYAKVNGEDAITLSVQKQGEANTSTVVSLVREELEKIQKDHPGTEVVITLDQGQYIDQMVESVSWNAIAGALLAVLILFIFLKDIRPTIIIGLAIPISVVVAFSAVYFTGITLNIVSMGGLALGIGMLVDNAVVVLENIYRLRKEGMTRVDAAIMGTTQVSGAIVASTLTTVAVFLPVIFVKGFTAQIFQEMALTVTITLLASLLVALTLVPMMSSKLIKKPDTSKHHHMMEASNRFYTQVLHWALKHKILVGALTLFAFSISIIGVLRVGTELMPATDEGQISIEINMPRGSLYQDTVTEVSKLEKYLVDQQEIETISASVGGGSGRMAFFSNGGADSGSINLVLVPGEERELSTQEVADRIREEMKSLSVADITVEMVSTGMMSMGASGISYTVEGEDFEKLESLARQVAEIIRNTEGSIDVEDGISKGSPELTIRLDEEVALPKGLTTAQVAGMVSELLAQEVSTTVNIEGQLVDVIVTDSSREKVQLEDLESLEFMTIQGETVLLSEIADIEEGSGYTSINRLNQKRTLTVSAKLIEGYDLGTVNKLIEEKVADLDIPEGYEVRASGEAEQLADSFQSLGLALLLGAVLVYMIMASQFESLIYPFVIIFSVPFAYSGAFLALFITNTPLSIVGFLGLIMLTGIVVNNGIVLIDYVNQLKQSGLSTREAILQAGPTRLRPILMTVLTTVLGLLPIALGIGEGAETIEALGLTVTGGLLFSTILTLVIIPVVYDLFDAIKLKVLRRKNRS